MLKILWNFGEVWDPGRGRWTAASNSQGVHWGARGATAGGSPPHYALRLRYFERFGLKIRTVIAVGFWASYCLPFQFQFHGVRERYGHSQPEFGHIMISSRLSYWIIWTKTAMFFSFRFIICFFFISFQFVFVFVESLSLLFIVWNPPLSSLLLPPSSPPSFLLSQPNT